MTAKEKLDQLLKENPNLLYEMTLTDISKICGCSRERIRQLVPTAARVRIKLSRKELIDRLYKYIDEHPESLNYGSKYTPGIPIPKIAKEIGTSTNHLKNLFQELGIKRKSKYEGMTSNEIQRWRYHNLPGRKEKVRKANQKWQEKAGWVGSESQKKSLRKALTKYANKVIGERQCPVCLETKPYTNGQKNNKTCSNRCHGKLVFADQQLRRMYDGQSNSA